MILDSSNSMAKSKLGIDITAELQNIDGQITEARKLGDKQTIAELRIKHKDLSRLQAAGIETTKGDKKPAKKTQRGNAEQQELSVETPSETPDSAD